MTDDASRRPLHVVGEASDTTNPFVKLAEQLVVGEGEIFLDLSAFQVEDGYPVTQCVNAIRELLVRGAHVTIAGAPAILADGITRAGFLLPPTTLRLVDVRES